MTLTTISPPAAEPLLLADAKLACSVSEDDWDDLIARFIRGARAQVETYLRRRLITQTVRLALDGFGSGGICLPVGPIQSVDQVQYTDGAGAVQTMAASGYRLVQSRQPNELHPVYGGSWPVPRAEADSVWIDLVVGYGAAGTDVPADIVDAVSWLVAHRFEHREAAVVGVMPAELPFAVRDTLSPHVFWV